MNEEREKDWLLLRTQDIPGIDHYSLLHYCLKKEALKKAEKKEQTLEVSKAYSVCLGITADFVIITYDEDDDVRSGRGLQG